MTKHQTTPRTPPPSIANVDDERILTTEELLDRVPLDRSTVWRMSREGRFPKPIQLTPARIGWRWSAVVAWLADREANPVEARLYFGRRKAAPSADRGSARARAAR